MDEEHIEGDADVSKLVTPVLRAEAASIVTLRLQAEILARLTGQPYEKLIEDIDDEVDETFQELCDHYGIGDSSAGYSVMDPKTGERVTDVPTSRRARHVCPDMGGMSPEKG